METAASSIIKQDTLAIVLQRFGMLGNGQVFSPETAMPIEVPNFGRNMMAEMFAELSFKHGAEIGTERGDYAETLCKANQNLNLTCVDPWKSYRGYRDHVNQQKLDRFYDETIQRLASFSCKIVRKFSMDALHLFADESLDFVYLDANHAFRYIAEDLVEWSKKVRRGGIIAGHDYARPKDKARPEQNAVPFVVHAYTQAYAIAPWFVLGVYSIHEGWVRDPDRTYLWVKP